MSYVDTAIAAISSIVGVAVGVLLGAEVDSRKTKKIKTEDIILVTARTASVFINLITAVGLNQSKLGPIMEKNLDGKRLTKSQFHEILDDALSVFPVPIPQEIPQASEDSYGYTLVELAKVVASYVQKSNELASQLKSGDMSSETVARFLVSLEMSVNVDFIIETGAKEFSIYLDALEDIHGTKLQAKERDEGVAKFESDLRRIHDHAVELREAMETGMAANLDFLKQVNWDSP